MYVDHTTGSHLGEDLNESFTNSLSPPPTQVQKLSMNCFLIRERHDNNFGNEFSNYIYTYATK